MPLSWKMAVALLVPALVVLHLVIASTWEVTLVNNLYKPLTSIIGLCFITTPLFAFMVASIEGKAGQTSAPAGNEDARLDFHRKVHSLVIMSSMLAILGIIMISIELTVGLDIGIDIKSSFVPRNFLTWIGTALVATVTFFMMQGGNMK